MAKLYKGKEVQEVPHPIDIKEWVKAGWSLDEPIDEKTLSDEDLKFNDLIIDIENLKADDVKFVAQHLSIEYSNIEDTREKVIDFLNLDNK